MAQTKRKRRRKHRGTQGGSIDRRRKTRPRSREEARAQARRQAELRRERPPTWGSAINRALIGGLIFFALIVLAFGQPVGSAIGLTLLMFLLYVPMGYYMERFFYNRRRAAQAKARQKAAQQGRGRG